MRRNVGRHSDRDPARAIDEQIGIARGEDGRFGFRAVVIGLEIDGVLVEIAEQRVRDLGEARFGRSDERRVGKECVSTVRSRWSTYHSNKKNYKVHHFSKL